MFIHSTYENVSTFLGGLKLKMEVAKRVLRKEKIVVQARGRQWLKWAKQTTTVIAVKNDYLEHFLGRIRSGTIDKNLKNLMNDKLW